MENMNIEEIREENDMDEYYERIDAMTSEERRNHYEKIREYVEAMQSVIESFSQKWLDYCLRKISECAENEDWEDAKYFLAESREAVRHCHTEACHRIVWKSLGDDAPRTYMDSEFFRLLEKVRKLSGADSKGN